MISKEVKKGSVGVAKSCVLGLFLLQADDGEEQARIVLTKDQLERLIQDIRKLIPRTPTDLETSEIVHKLVQNYLEHD